MFKGKEVNVALIGDAKEIYFELKKIVSEQNRNKKVGTESQKILESIERTIDNLKNNPQFGIHIKRNMVPLYYIKNYNAKNLWKCDLAYFWRLIYWIDGKDVKIVCFVLDIINHRDYNKIFKYNKN